MKTFWLEFEGYKRQDVIFVVLVVGANNIKKFIHLFFVL